MSSKKIDKIIDETVFTMEAEGFVMTSEEKDVIRKVLNGEISFSAQLEKYIDDAKHIGGLSNASRQRV